ncbi:hypothetical protein FB45DRAFT_881216 [Roridomyces roridus]|uniref:Uncharacterized protein n=1 Tax=Roridomyces roridus TaxID=1738132 RepID=A0AAD7AXU1_9AGAR|nr:hypothetical protein FB45DRAFT_881216 [Roridomyces roridus]
MPAGGLYNISRCATKFQHIIQETRRELRTRMRPQVEMKEQGAMCDGRKTEKEKWEGIEGKFEHRERLLLALFPAHDLLKSHVQLFNICVRGLKGKNLQLRPRLRTRTQQEDMRGKTLRGGAAIGLYLLRKPGSASQPQSGCSKLVHVSEVKAGNADGAGLAESKGKESWSPHLAKTRFVEDVHPVQSRLVELEVKMRERLRDDPASRPKGYPAKIQMKGVITQMEWGQTQQVDVARAPIIDLEMRQRWHHEISERCKNSIQSLVGLYNDGQSRDATDMEAKILETRRRLEVAHGAQSHLYLTHSRPLEVEPKELCGCVGAEVDNQSGPESRCACNCVSKTTADMRQNPSLRTTE